MKEIKKPTWMVHCVFDEEKVVFHTHGLDKYGSLELELNLPLNEKQGAVFVNAVGFVIANGRKFKDGDTDENIFNCKIAFVETEGIFGDGERNLRIILPDPNLKFPWDEGCEEPYKSQIWTT